MRVLNTCCAGNCATELDFLFWSISIIGSTARGMNKLNCTAQFPSAVCGAVQLVYCALCPVPCAVCVQLTGLDLGLPWQAVRGGVGAAA